METWFFITKNGNICSKKDKIYLKKIMDSYNHLDDPSIVNFRSTIIKKKKFLYKIYEEWYTIIRNNLSSNDQPVLEIGSGPGFLKQFCKNKKIITSEIMYNNKVDLIFDAAKLFPFKNNSLSAIVMTDVLHHLPNVKTFFEESIRVLIDNGKIIMIEPWCTFWSKFIYSNFHHETFDTEVKEWEFESRGPLSDANGALPWIIFKRDYLIFSKLYPQLELKTVKLLMPISYLLSGGFSYPSLIPHFFYKLIRKFENFSNVVNKKMAMFAYIEIINHKINRYE